MKNSIFVWIPIFIYAILLPLSYFTSYNMPFDGAIFLIGGSLVGYTGIKSFGVTMTAIEMPKGEGFPVEIKERMTRILVAIYILIIGSVFVMFLDPEKEIPIDNLLYLAAVSSAFVLGGVQAMKYGENINGGLNESIADNPSDSNNS